MPKKIARTKVEAAVAELDKVRRNWLKRPGVTAVDVGYKIKDVEMTDELAIRVHVRRKKPIEALETHDVFSTSGDPKKQGPFTIDVIEAEYGPERPQIELTQPEALDRKGRVDPLVGGVSVGNPRVSAGTLGAIVWDRTDGEICMLSNWHVLCGSSTCTAGEDIYQPGVFDGGTAADKVAELKRWRLDRDADAALAKLTGARAYSRDILDLNPIAGVEENPTLGMTVTKSGRTTDVTEGLVDGVSLSTTINYGGGTVVTFHDQLHIVPLPPWPAVNYEVSRGGDSGSVWIDKATNKAIGLHFAGETDPSPTAEHAIANRMVEVAKALNFSFTPLFRPAPPVWDDRLRDILRRILCRYIPQLCYRRSPFESLPAAQDPALQGLPGEPPVCSAGTRPQSPAPTMPVDIEWLLDAVMEELQRSR
jgi:endonuclease G